MSFNIRTNSGAPPSSATAVPPALDTSGMRGRQIGITLAMVFCIIGTLFGTGIIGTRIAEASGGDLAADATLIAPAGPAFSIWGVIYLGLLSYTVWQWRTEVAASPRHRAIAVPVMASLVLNGAWILVTQANWIWMSVLVIIALLLACAFIVKGLHEHAPVQGTAVQSKAEKIITDGTFGIYLGWVCVAICANIAAAAVSSGAPKEGLLPTVLTMVVLAAVVAVAAIVARAFGARLAVAAAIIWGLSWVAVGRLTDEPESLPVGIAAILAAVAVALVTWLAAEQRKRVRSAA